MEGRGKGGGRRGVKEGKWRGVKKREGLCLFGVKKKGRRGRKGKEKHSPQTKGRWGQKKNKNTITQKICPSFFFWWKNKRRRGHGEPQLRK